LAVFPCQPLAKQRRLATKKMPKQHPTIDSGVKTFDLCKNFPSYLQTDINDYRAVIHAQ